MKVLILEDEPVHAKYLTKMLIDISGSTIDEIKHVSTIDEADEQLNQSSVDIFF